MAVDPRIFAKTVKALTKMRMRAYCQTCGELFLEISGIDYVEKSSHLKTMQPDKWFVETGIHWCENEGHLIMLDILEDGSNLVHQQSITEIWDNKLFDDQVRKPDHTRELQRSHFYKFRETCRNKKI